MEHFNLFKKNNNMCYKFSLIYNIMTMFNSLCVLREQYYSFDFLKTTRSGLKLWFENLKFEEYK